MREKVIGILILIFIIVMSLIPINGDGNPPKTYMSMDGRIVKSDYGSLSCGTYFEFTDNGWRKIVKVNHSN